MEAADENATENEIAEYMNKVSLESSSELIVCRPMQIQEALKTPATTLEEMNARIELIMHKVQSMGSNSE